MSQARLALSVAAPTIDGADDIVGEHAERRFCPGFVEASC